MKYIIDTSKLYEEYMQNIDELLSVDNSAEYKLEGIKKVHEEFSSLIENVELYGVGMEGT